jgi:DNA-binding HxlR family transcriptional regulator
LTVTADNHKVIKSNYTIRISKRLIPARRAYDDGCMAAHALNLVGDRWCLLIVRELLPGPRRFTDLREGLPGLSANVLTQRLDALESDRVLRRRKLPPPARAWVYELTAWGRELEPILEALARWGTRSPALPAQAPASTAATVLLLRSAFEPGRAAGVKVRVAVTLGQERFEARVHEGRLTIERGECPEADAGMFAAAEVVAALALGRRSLAESLEAGEIRIEGDPRAIERFLALFPLPGGAGARAGS